MKYQLLSDTDKQSLFSLVNYLNHPHLPARALIFQSCAVQIEAALPLQGLLRAMKPGVTISSSMHDFKLLPAPTLLKAQGLTQSKLLQKALHRALPL